jgi:flagellar protein FliO/FliZ
MTKKILKIAMALFLFVHVVAVFADESDASSSVEVEAGVGYGLDTPESSIDISSQASSASSSAGASTVWAFVKMIIVLLVVLACIYGVFFLFKKNSRVADSSDPFLRRVSIISLSPGKSVQVVTLLDKAYIIGVTDNSINLLGQVDDKELVDSMNLYADKNNNTSKPRSFADVLDLFMPHGPRSGNVFASSADDVASVLKKQRENFNNSDEGE